MEPACRSSRSSGSLCSQRERPLQKEAGFPQLSPTHDNQRKPACSNEDPAQAKVNKSNYFVKKKKKKRLSLSSCFTETSETEQSQNQLILELANCPHLTWTGFIAEAGKAERGFHALSLLQRDASQASTALKGPTSSYCLTYSVCSLH